MINRLIELCFRRRHIAWGVAIILAFYGYISCTHMAVEAYPELSDVTVQVTTQVPGLAAEEIEKQITIPLERVLTNVPELSSIRSSSTFALSLITLVFQDGANDYFVRDRVLNHISQATLPNGIQPTLDPLTGAGGEIYRYTLESNTKNLMELSEIQRWIVIPTLKQVPGVSDVNNFGGLTKQYELVIDPQKMQHYGIVLNDVATAIGNNTSNAGGGRISRGEQSYIVRGIGQINSLSDLGQVVVTQKNSVPVLVRDLGQLQFGHQEREGILGKNNNPDSIQGVVLMRKYENPSQVLKQLHAQIDTLQEQLKSQDVKIAPYLDRDDLVQVTSRQVRETIIEGIFFVCLVLILFIGNIRTALVVTIAIPAALVSVFIMMNETHTPANLFSLGAIDFGVIVDAAIVVMEAILRQREENPQIPLSVEDTLKATGYVARPIFFATLIIISAYLPLFAFQRAEGKLFTPMAYTISYALLGALICALTLVPGLAYTALHKPRKIVHNRPLIWLTRRYRILLAHLLTRPRFAYISGALVLIMVLLLGITAGREFLPDLDEGSLWVQADMPSGISLEKANEMAGELRRSLLKHPEVSYVVTQLGRSDDGTDPWTPSHVEACVGLKPYSQWPDRENKDQFIEKLDQQFSQMPGYTVGISQPIIDNINDLISGSHSPLALRIYGEDLKEGRRIGEEIVNILKTIPGTASASVFQQPPIPQMVVKIDRKKIARYGINVGDITNLIQTGLGGAPVALIYVGNRIYNATVRFPKDNKNSTEALGNLFLSSSIGAKIVLSQLASINYQTGESNIMHEQTKREITVRIDNRGRDLTSYLHEAQKRINSEVQFDHQKFTLEWAGQFESQERAQKRFAYILLIVLVLMSILLFLQFQKLRFVLLVLGVVPLATVGGLITLHITGQTLNAATAVGFIALFGVSVQNGIIIVANIRRISNTV
ncbi:efflux RND transporter permease subunit [Legionella fallonii]|uniref:Putative cation efflux system protein CzcA n=1 Tax=Legionella fallonii LLAP-10 TaxID=1212491 RepID=A0A098G8B7_9GAMM|nr:CusA/CzcA family heavy metal efflux RND transporter [Legionella fallonii]CEG58728.1 putative cation efflux system protein CzcA [Legionella fallonii LLAP-10]